MSDGTLPKPPTGPPYPPHVAAIGGEPTVIPDVPICAVFIFLYLCFAVTNLGLFNINRSKGHFFFPSALLGGFCMARVLTCCLRIGWATRHQDIPLAIAAQIFVNAGILIVYIVNLIFAQRILRAKQPKLGWHRALKAVFISAYVLIGVALVLVITLNVISFYTLDIATLEDAHWILRGAILYLMIFTTFPIILLALAYGLPRSEHEENFGHGSLHHKAIILGIGACICILISGFKAGVFWSPQRPISDPAWYDDKAPFYCFNFMTEILILALYTPSRVDKRFHVPNGSSKRRTFVKPAEDEEVPNDEEVGDEEKDLEKRTDSGSA